jgi:outer membrane lipoprotein-sorting protein
MKKAVRNRSLGLIICFGFVVSLLSTVSAQGELRKVSDTARLISSINQASAAIASIRSDFTQIKQLSFLEEQVTSTGKFYFKKEKQLRWEYTKPYEYIVVLSNDKILIKDEGKVTSIDAASSKMFGEINRIMVGIVRGTLFNSAEFSVEYFENDSFYQLFLTPLEPGMKDFLKQIQIFINKKDLTVDALKMVEKSGDYTYIKFQNKALNAEIPDHIFNLD